MSIFLTNPQPEETPVPAVRTDATKRALLKTAVEALLQPLADTKTAVEGGAQVDIFAMAVALKDQVEAGTLSLQHGDYDGCDIAECVTEILDSV
jgi:hypothetical protein